MLNRIFGFQFNWPEFFFGVLLGLAGAWVTFRLKPLYVWAKEAVLEVYQGISENLRSGATDRYRVEFITRAETLHMARAIFALDEIIITPRLLASPAPVETESAEGTHQDALSVLPSLPDATVLSGIYRAPSLALGEAMASNVDLLITGELGAGKSTALAYLALLAAKRDPLAGPAAQMAPFLAHAANLRLDRRYKDPLEPLIDAILPTVTPSMAPRLPSYMHQAYRQKRALMLLDGLDELPIEEIEPIAAWIPTLREAYPGCRIVASGPAQHYDGMTKAGLAPIPIAPWSDQERRDFFDRWGSAWAQFVSPRQSRSRLRDIDPALLNGWLTGSLRAATPLEVTLRTWAAYAGDMPGAEMVDSLNAYVDRFISPDERPFAEAAGLAWLSERQGAVPERQLRRGTPIGDLVEAGILVRRTAGRVSFFQPGLGAYLAARAMAEGSVPKLAEQGGWLPIDTAVGFLACLRDISGILDARMAIPDPLDTVLLDCAHWLRFKGPQGEWRPALLRSVARITQASDKPYGLRLRSVHALVAANEPSAAILFRRMLASSDPAGRVLAALGLGGMADQASVENLTKVMNEDREAVVRIAACLGLAGVGSTPALEALGHALLRGDEPIRVAAAEALAINIDEGYGMLREAAELDDLHTRRAAVFGLARVPLPFATELLEKVQVEDGQWVVRGAAAEASERRRKPVTRLSTPARDPSELPWLVAYAAKQGLGVAPGKPAYEMVRKSLASGTLEEQLAAVETLAWTGGEDFGLELSQALGSSNSFLRDAAYEALWRLHASRSSVPLHS
jgi:HEAT repeat protein